MENCLTCGHWAKEGKTNAQKKRWCRELQTWTAPGFFCKAYSDIPTDIVYGPFYTIGEVAESCHVDESTVRYWIYTGRLSASPLLSEDVKLAGQFRTQWKIAQEPADRYIEWYNSITAKNQRS